MSKLLSANDFLVVSTTSNHFLLTYWFKHLVFFKVSFLLEIVLDPTNDLQSCTNVSHMVGSGSLAFERLGGFSTSMCYTTGF